MARNEQNQRLHNTSFLYGANASYIQDLYYQFKKSPNTVSDEWQRFFAQQDESASDVLKDAKGASWKRDNWPLTEQNDLISAFSGECDPERNGNPLNHADLASKIVATAHGSALTDDDIHKATQDSIRAIMMIRAYRARGHLQANLDPLEIAGVQEDFNELDPSNYGFESDDCDRPIFIDHYLGLEYATVNQMVAILKRTYCSTIGVEFMHISDPEAKSWMQQRIEGPDKEIAFTQNGKRAIFNKLVEAEGFEKFLDIRYTGTKRFGLDGAEALVPALEQIIKRGGQLGVQEIVLGMAHRGRLNVLAQVMGKPHPAIFHEFKGGSYAPDEVEGSGDVKYHLGASSDRVFDGNKVHLSLIPNPSHLEIVNPVVLGKARAKQDQTNEQDETGSRDRRNVLPLLLHGDAAFAGQGVVAECFGLSGLKGHRTGGSIHFVINNQIGFTTNPNWSRSSPYPTDVAKLIEAPIFHVNGDDPEAVVYAAKVAIEFRQKFARPVVIDMFCYRRFGHNEGDEPSFTQPKMYKKIRSHPTTLEIYANKLINEGVLNEAEVEAAKSAWRTKLDQDYEAGQTYQPNRADWLDGEWAGLTTADNEDDARRGKTGVAISQLMRVGAAITKIPENFQAHRTIQRFMKNRAKMFETGQGLDWATGEALAFGTLCLDGHLVRLSGQDCERGTFSQRHTVLYDQESEERYIPLNHIDPRQAEYGVINSMLSEEAVLGYEYGYSLQEPNGLILWEAQFGDFANGAQVLFDQFISSAERKWLRMSGLVCLLPHGYEGQGPEHSSARLERFLQMCAEDNMQVANCTTPANYFHILRRQLRREFRKPLILMTPKSLLRHKMCVSRLSDFDANSTFHRVLWDDAELDHTPERIVEDSKIRKIVLCTGKVYFDLYEGRKKRGLEDIYIMRLEQLYPFPARAAIAELSRFKHAEIVWCQEEPKNMGSWAFVEPYLEWALNHIGAHHARPIYAGRPPSAATATGLMSTHLSQLEAFTDEAFA